MITWSLLDSSLLQRILSPAVARNTVLLRTFHLICLQLISDQFLQLSSDETALQYAYRKGMFSIPNSQNKIHKLTFINDENSSITIRSDLFQRILLKCNFCFILKFFIPYSFSVDGEKFTSNKKWRRHLLHCFLIFLTELNLNLKLSVRTLQQKYRS